MVHTVTDSNAVGIKIIRKFTTFAKISTWQLKQHGSMITNRNMWFGLVLEKIKLNKWNWIKTKTLRLTFN